MEIWPILAHFGPLFRKSGRATGQAALPVPIPTRTPLLLSIM